jgi:hypothetical protein
VGFAMVRSAMQTDDKVVPVLNENAPLKLTAERGGGGE